jgi:hypothetical protein
MKDRVPVVPVHRPGGLPFSEIRPTRDPEDSPWLESFINLGADQSRHHEHPSHLSKKPPGRVKHPPPKKAA